MYLHFRSLPAGWSTYLNEDEDVVLIINNRARTVPSAVKDET